MELLLFSAPSAVPSLAFASGGKEVFPRSRCFLPSWNRRIRGPVLAAATPDKGAASTGNAGGSGGVRNSNYVVPLDKAPSLMRPLNEILRDLNKRVPDKIINIADNSIPWYHTNRMLSFYAPGWCGEVRDVIFSENGYVSVIYRVTVRGSDGEAHREATGTVAMNDGRFEDPVATAEELAFCKACARFGFGLYLYHEDDLL